MPEEAEAQRAADPFWFRECFLMPMPLGRRASNLRELMEVVRDVRESVLFYHLIQSRLTIGPPAPEYPNDFAFWAANSLQDRKLAEILSTFDPFEFATLEDMRLALGDLLEEYLWDLAYIPWARPGFEFHFAEASTVVLRSETPAYTLQEFARGLKEVGLDSIYYHFFEARWRLGELGKDDFSFWLENNFRYPELVEVIRDIDVYFHSLREIKESLLALIAQYLGEDYDRAE